jgi:hypothetical protein
VLLPVGPLCHLPNARDAGEIPDRGVPTADRRDATQSNRTTPRMFLPAFMSSKPSATWSSE